MRAYRYIYEEEAPIDTKYLLHEDLPAEMRENITAAFKDAGGIKIETVIGGHPLKKRIISLWKSPGGYIFWSVDPRVKAYIEYRDEYNRKNKIETALIGPTVQFIRTGLGGDLKL